jgi:hypothetical protein
MENETTYNSFSMRLNEAAVNYLRESARWSYFLSIIGFIGIAMMVVASVFMGIFLSEFSISEESASPFSGMMGMFSWMYILIAVLYFFPIWYLYNYASKTKNALEAMDSEMLTKGFENLKSHHKFLGIAAIVMMSMYVLIFVSAIIFTATL